MELNIPELNKLIESVEELKKIILSSDSLTQEWYDLETACNLKGVNKNTLYAKPKYQPNYGKSDAIICGKKRWNKETIRVWLKQTDENIPEIYR
jgi:hypothetical protein